MNGEHSKRIPPDAVLSGWALAAALEALERMHGHHLASMTADEQRDARDHWRRQAQETLSAVHAALTGGRQPGAGAAVLSFTDTDEGGLEIGVLFDPALTEGPDGEMIGTPAQGLAARTLAGVQQDFERSEDGVAHDRAPATPAQADAGSGATTQSANLGAGAAELRSGDVVAVGVGALERIHGHHLAAMSAELEREARGQWRQQAEEMLAAVEAALTRERPAGVGTAVIALVDAGEGRADVRADYEPALEDTASGGMAGTRAQTLAAQTFSAVSAGRYSDDSEAPAVPDLRGPEE
jgi:hypothetical protein